MNNKVKNYVLAMLGAPVVQVEIDNDQLALCEECAKEFLDQHIRRVNAEEDPQTYEMALQEGALIYAKMMLGRIRSKYINTPGPNCCSGYSGVDSGVGCLLDGGVLLAEAREEIDTWKENVTSYYFPSPAKEEDDPLFMTILSGAVANSNGYNSSKDDLSDALAYTRKLVKYIRESQEIAKITTTTECGCGHCSCR